MAKQGFGSDHFDALARRYWNAWGEALRGASGSEAPDPAASTTPGWNEAIDWWSQLARSSVSGGSGQADATIARFSTQASAWFGQMQQLAARFAGRDADAAEIVQAWKQALGGEGANPFADLLGSLHGPGQHDLSDWWQQVAPHLQRWQRESGAWLDAPAFGFAREHQQRWQRLAQAQLDSQQQSQAYQALLAEAVQDAFARFERKLTERSEPGRQIDSARALFDLWIDAAEEAYADIALSPRFRDAYAALVNSQMRLRANVQAEIEQASAQLGMPTRTELDSAHRKIVQLERELRQLRDMVQAQAAATSDPAPAAVKPGTKPRAAGKRAAVAKPAAKPVKKPAAAKARQTTATKPTKHKPVKGKR
ncbi:class III poly(R)-hydroxyalkanoic acid synthase subunit PhaE [Lysobacter cavernae]|uniref:Poly(3-hydroxyalkanoate) polymerase subunit PhaE n=1 Tax=Lysobacter cavernae TaxID=1685901 RepID=A0ABV7RLU5_9GAMM